MAPVQPDILKGIKLVAATLALGLGSFMNILDLTIVNVAVPTMAGDFAVTPTQGTWIITSYSVAEAIMLPLAGFLLHHLGITGSQALLQVMLDISRLLLVRVASRCLVPFSVENEIVVVDFSNLEDAHFCVLRFTALFCRARQTRTASRLRHVLHSPHVQLGARPPRLIARLAAFRLPHSERRRSSGMLARSRVRRYFIGPRQ